MKKVLTIITVAAMLLSFAVPVAAVDSAEGSTLRLQKTEGTVSVKNASGKLQNIKNGMRLYSGYMAGTEAESYAYISLDDSKVIKLDAQSEVEVQQSGKKLEVLLSKGSFFFDVSQKVPGSETLNIRTSTMLTGIRGTMGEVRLTEITIDLSKYIGVKLPGGETLYINKVTHDACYVLAEDGSLSLIDGREYAEDNMVYLGNVLDTRNKDVLSISRTDIFLLEGELRVETISGQVAYMTAGQRATVDQVDGTGEVIIRMAGCILDDISGSSQMALAESASAQQRLAAGGAYSEEEIRETVAGAPEALAQEQQEQAREAAEQLAREQIGEDPDVAEESIHPAFDIIGTGAGNGVGGGTPVAPYDTPDIYNVTMNNSGSGASGTGGYHAGDTVTLNPGARDGYVFDGWSSSSVTISGNSFTMPAADVSVDALWTQTEYTVTLPSGDRFTVDDVIDGGSIFTDNGDGTLTVPVADAEGAELQIVIAPAPGYEFGVDFAAEAVNADAVVSGDTVTISDITGDVTVTVTGIVSISRVEVIVDNGAEPGAFNITAGGSTVRLACGDDALVYDLTPGSSLALQFEPVNGYAYASGSAPKVNIASDSVNMDIETASYTANNVTGLVTLTLSGLKPETYSIAMYPSLDYDLTDTELAAYGLTEEVDEHYDTYYAGTYTFSEENDFALPVPELPDDVLTALEEAEESLGHEIGSIDIGWHEAYDMSDAAVTKIAAGTFGDKTYYIGDNVTLDLSASGLQKLEILEAVLDADFPINTINLIGGAVFGDDDWNSTVTIPAGKTVNLTGGTYALPSDTTSSGVAEPFLFAGGTLNIAEDAVMKLDDDISLPNGPGEVNNYGKINVGAGGSVSITNVFYNYGTLTNAGNVDISGTLENYGTIRNAGLITNENNLIICEGGELINGGSLGSSGATGELARGIINNGSLSVNGTLTNSGEILMAERSCLEVSENGALTNNGTILFTGSFPCQQILRSGSTLTNYGTISLTGKTEFNMDPGSTLTNGSSGEITVYGGIEDPSSRVDFNNSGTLINSGEITVSCDVENPDALAYFNNYGTLTNSGKINIAGCTPDHSVFYNNGTLINAGEVLVKENGEFCLESDSALTNNGTISLTGSAQSLMGSDSELTNNGTISLTEDADFNMESGSTLTNGSSGKITLVFGSAVPAYKITLVNYGMLTNSGEITVSCDIEDSNAYVYLDNYGLLTNSGKINIASCIPRCAYFYSSGTLINAGEILIKENGEFCLESVGFLVFSDGGLLTNNGTLEFEEYSNLYFGDMEEYTREITIGEDISTFSVYDSDGTLLVGPVVSDGQQKVYAKDQDLIVGFEPADGISVTGDGATGLHFNYGTNDLNFASCVPELSGGTIAETYMVSIPADSAVSVFVATRLGND